MGDPGAFLMTPGKPAEVLLSTQKDAPRLFSFTSESEYSGERVSNGWKTCPSMGDNSSNELLIPHTTFESHGLKVKDGLSLKLSLKDGSASH